MACLCNHRFAGFPITFKYCDILRKITYALDERLTFLLIVFPLQEVIDLTKDLLTSQPTDSASSTNGSETVPLKLGWKVGDRCMAAWSQDGQ